MIHLFVYDIGSSTWWDSLKADGPSVPGSWSQSWNVGLPAATLLWLLSILLPSAGFCLQAHRAVGCPCSPAQFAFLHGFSWPCVYQSLARPSDVTGGPSFHKCFLSAAVPTVLVVAGAANSNYWPQHALLLTPHNDYCSWAWVWTSVPNLVVFWFHIPDDVFKG